MRPNRMRNLTFGILVTVLMLLMAGCNEPRLKSRWLDRTITIDGIGNEWEDYRLHYDKDTETSIGVFNDTDFLYIGLVTTDRMIQRQIIGKSFTVWFDPKGGKDKQLGIRYPTGILGVSEAWEKYEKRSRSRRRYHDRGDNGGPAGEQATSLLEEMSKTLPTGFEILVPVGHDDWDSTFVDEDQDVGIQAQLTLAGGRLVYELKIPISKNDQMPHSIIASKRGKIGIGFETPKIDVKEMRKRRGRGRMGLTGDAGVSAGGREGGRGGGTGGKGGRGGRGGKGGGYKKYQPKSLALWTTVRLASPPDN